MTPDLLPALISFNIGLVIGAGIAWGLVMYKWEPIIGVECKFGCTFCEEDGLDRNVGDL